MDKELRNRLMKERSDLAERIKHIDALLHPRVRMRSKKPKQAPSEIFFTESFPVETIKGMTQPQAMFAIARYYKGMLPTKLLKRYLQAAGLMVKTKNAGNIVYHLVANSQKFERVSTGLYKLIDGEAESSNSQAEFIRAERLQ